MAHLQPQTTASAPGAGRRLRLTSLRGFMPNTVHLSGREVRDVWQRHFAAKGAGHPFWLYTHVPFCPQICRFCQCSTSLKKSDDQVAQYLAWLDGELDFLADASRGAEVRVQYLGGGTPNLLSEPQLARLLGTLNDHFTFAPGSRRTFEFLPSSLRPETLPLVRSFGFNRLSCGVQSWSRETLRAVNRSEDGLDQLGRTIAGALALGYDEINLDLIHGIGAETSTVFLEGLLRVLASRPTTVTIHHVIPTPTNPVFATIDEELAAHERFERLEETLGAAVAREFPDVEWVLRPNSWIIVDRRFHRGGDFSPWYYSDNERIHIDMLGFGRFAHSNVLGEVCYENLSQADRYDPEEASYNAFRKTPAVDAALDLITDLVGDRGSDLAPIMGRYGRAAIDVLEPVLETLEGEGLVRRRDARWEPLATDGVFVDPFWPLLETAMQHMDARWSLPLGRDLERGIRIGRGAESLLVFVEKIVADRRYFATVGDVGVYYRNLDQNRTSDQGPWAGEIMAQFVEQVRSLRAASPTLSAKDITARLKPRLEGRDSAS
jgi:coproporphyrinogen III oxidase-like Fe-S oxidoreductase